MNRKKPRRNASLLAGGLFYSRPEAVSATWHRCNIIFKLAIDISVWT